MTNLTLVQVDFVANDYKWKAFRILKSDMFQKPIAPEVEITANAVEILKCLRVRDITYQNTAMQWAAPLAQQYI